MPRQRSADPAVKAREVLESMGIRAVPVPVDKVAKNLKAVVRYMPMDAGLSGMIHIKEGIPIIGINSLHPPMRQRFTLAHEIGHLVLHRDQISEHVHVDKQIRVLRRDSVAAEGTEKSEIEANRFAAELLMPQSSMVEVLEGRYFNLDDDSSYDDLTKRFKVSRQALEYRIANM